MKYFFIVFMIMFPQANASDWVNRVDKCGIRIDTRKVENFSINEFRVTTFLAKEASEVQKVIDDIKNFPKWHYGVRLANTVKIINENEKLIYMELNLPWPVRDRDSIATTKTSYNDGVYLTLINHYEGEYKKTNLIRIPYTKGFWKVETYEKGSKLTYQVLGDIGGNIPDFIVNMMLTKNPYITIMNFKKYLKLPDCE